MPPHTRLASAHDSTGTATKFTSDWSALDIELLVHIFQGLTVAEVANAQQSCKNWKIAGDRDDVWRALVLTQWPQYSNSRGNANMGLSWKRRCRVMHLKGSPPGHQMLATAPTLNEYTFHVELHFKPSGLIISDDNVRFGANYSSDKDKGFVAFQGHLEKCQWPEGAVTLSMFVKRRADDRVAMLFEIEADFDPHLHGEQSSFLAWTARRSALLADAGPAGEDLVALKRTVLPDGFPCSWSPQQRNLLFNCIGWFVQAPDVSEFLRWDEDDLIDHPEDAKHLAFLEILPNRSSITSDQLAQKLQADADYIELYHPLTDADLLNALLHESLDWV